MYWVETDLKNGELSWSRDIWNNSNMMLHWMELLTYQKYGIDFRQIEEES